MFGRFRTYVKFSGLELFKNGDCPDTNGGLLVSPNLVKLNEGLMAKFKAVDSFGRRLHKRNVAKGVYVAQLVQSTTPKMDSSGGRRFESCRRYKFNLS